MGGLIDSFFGGGDDNIQTPDDIYRLTQMQNRMSNPNMSNYFGSTTTTFDENDQPQINQQFSPQIQGLVDMSIASAQGGPNTFTPNANNYGNRMMGQFGDSFSNRMGAPPQAQYMQKPPANGFTPQSTPMSEPPQQAPPVGFAPPSLGGGAMGGSGGGNGIGLANQYDIHEFLSIPKKEFTTMQQNGADLSDITNNGVPVGDGSLKQNKIQQFLGHLGSRESDNPLAQALMNLGRKY